MSVSITWSELTYTVPVRLGRQLRKRGTKVVLDGVSGHVPPERLLAIMGPTGCGKTSVLNALAGRLPVGGKLEGDILVNELYATNTPSHAYGLIRTRTHVSQAAHQSVSHHLCLCHAGRRAV